MEKKHELLNPKIDVVFHSLFRKGNEDITKAIITAITNEKIKNIDLTKDRHVIGKYPEEKLGILDLKATLDDGTICDIEVQLANHKDTAERFLFYWARTYTSQLVKGDTYKKLNKVIGIIILDYKFAILEEIKSIHTKWQIKETLTGKELILTDKFELHIIEIPKAKRNLEQDKTNQLAQWMMFLNNPNEKEVSEIMKENKEIKKAMDELESLSQDEELRLVAELREKAIRDEKNGQIRWKEEGKEETVKEIVGRLLKMKQPIEFIMQITDLSKEEIVKIQDELK